LGSRSNFDYETVRREERVRPMTPIKKRPAESRGGGGARLHACLSAQAVFASLPQWTRKAICMCARPEQAIYLSLRNGRNRSFYCPPFWVDYETLTKAVRVAFFSIKGVAAVTSPDGANSDTATIRIYRDEFGTAWAGNHASTTTLLAIQARKALPQRAQPPLENRDAA
jgi:hypothetical protein